MGRRDLIVFLIMQLQHSIFVYNRFNSIGFECQPACRNLCIKIYGLLTVPGRERKIALPNSIPIWAGGI